MEEKHKNPDRGPDKRDGVRVKKNLIIRYAENIDAYQKKWDETIIRDISVSGISISESKNIPVGTELILLFKIPSSPYQWFEVKGKIVKVDKLKTIRNDLVSNTNIVGIAFIDLTDEQKVTIKEYVDWFLSKSGGEK